MKLWKEMAMNKMEKWIHIGLLSLLVLGVSLGSAAPASALEGLANPGDEIDERLEQCYSAAQDWYDIQDGNLDLADDILDQVADIVEQLQEHGFDTSQLEALLAQANALLPTARTDHDQAAVILAEHAGFDGGQVVDRQAAWDTCRTAAQALDGARRTLLEIRSLGLEMRQIVLDWRANAGGD
jgi:hypothetical protein